MVEDLLRLAEASGIAVEFRHLPENLSLSVDWNGRQFIAMDVSRLFRQADGRVRLAHELGHCQTGSFYCLHAAADVRGRQEYRADKWAVHQLVPPHSLLTAMAGGCTEVWQLAERFGVTEDFIRRAQEIYRREGVLG